MQVHYLRWIWMNYWMKEAENYIGKVGEETTKLDSALS